MTCEAKKHALAQDDENLYNKFKDTCDSELIQEVASRLCRSKDIAMNARKEGVIVKFDKNWVNPPTRLNPECCPRCGQPTEIVTLGPEGRVMPEPPLGDFEIRTLRTMIDRFVLEQEQRAHQERIEPEPTSGDGY